MRSFKMRHRKSRHQLNRFTSWRRATLRSLIRNLFLHQSIRTTKTKAKAVRPLAEKLISLTKQNSLFAKRQAFRIINDHKLVSLLFNDIGPRFINKTSGYTRILSLGLRRGDNAELALLELTVLKKKELRKPKKEEKEAAPKELKEEKPKILGEKPVEEKRAKTELVVKEKPPITKKPTKRFLGGLRKIFKKERDSL